MKPDANSQPRGKPWAEPHRMALKAKSMTEYEPSFTHVRSRCRGAHGSVDVIGDCVRQVLPLLARLRWVVDHIAIDKQSVADTLSQLYP